MSTADPLANKNLQSNLQWSLLFLRVGVFIVMFIWTLDKFVNPAHSIKIFEHFYKIDGLNDIIAYGLGALQLILVIAFLFGIKKRLSYGLIFLIHAGSTLSAYALYIDAFNNLLFFAAWPMLAACAALYLLRDADTKFTLGK
jgi:putative oxidoreductase